MPLDSRIVQQSERRVGSLRWTIGAVMTAGVASATLFWHGDVSKNFGIVTKVVELDGPLVLKDTLIDRVSAGAPRYGVGANLEPLVGVKSSVAGSQIEAAAPDTFAEKSPVTVLAQFGNGPGGRGLPGDGNRPGGGGPGNGNQGPGGGGPFGGTGQGAGGVYMATNIQLKPNASVGLTDRRNTVLLQRPAPGRFYSD